MITIDCPFCDGEATTDGRITTVVCDGCGIATDVAADVASILEAAA
jgi:hypothetical protein